ncbi:unnamed protein product, partial [Didymodactylos carnosus]
MPRSYVKKNNRQHYSNDDLRQALNSINDGKSIRQVAADSHIPLSTLQRHASGDVLQFGSGRSTHFTIEEEKHLANALTVLHVKEWGEPLTIEEFLKLVAIYTKHIKRPDMFKDGTPSRDWYYGFMTRQCDLKLKTPQPLEKARVDISQSTITKWCALIESIFEKCNLMDKPSQIFNCDETGFSDKSSAKKVLVRKNKRFTYQVQYGSGKAHITTLFCISTSGQILPPYIDAGYNCSRNGWMEEEIFFKWFMEICIPYIKDIARPLLLILDGHSSHRSVRLVEAAIEHQVILFALPLHTTHILQPLDVVVFKPVKEKWKQILSLNENSGKPVNKDNFPGLLAQLFEKGVIKKSNIVLGTLY